MDYTKSGFDDNLIRAGYSLNDENQIVYDQNNVAEVFPDGAVTVGDIQRGLILAGVMDTSFYLIKDVVNARLDSASKKILSDFNFGTVNYAGAVKAGDIAWNIDTGAITGGSGVALFRKGIVGAKAGVATFTLDAETGDATFAGTLSAPTGTLGALTLAAGGNIKMGKTAFTDDTNAGFFLGDVSGVAKFKIGSSATKFFSYDGTDVAMAGGTITGGIIQTGTTGYNVKLDGSTGQLQLRSGTTVIASILSDGTNSLILDTNNNIYFREDGTTQLAALNSDGLLLPSGKSIYFASGSTLTDNGDELRIDRQTRFNGTIYPRVDNSVNCGDGSKRWDVVYCTSLSETSNRNLKKDITEISKPAINSILSLRPVEFKWKRNNIPAIGFIAEELAEVFPELVFRTKNEETGEADGDIAGISYSKLTVFLVRAIQEQQAQIDELKRIKVK